MIICLKEQVTRKMKSVIIYSSPCQQKVEWSFAVHQTYLDLHSKEVLKHSPKKKTEVDGDLS